MLVSGSARATGAAPLAEPDAPPLGRSVFDALFVSPAEPIGSYELPYPFHRLLERIEATLGPREGRESPLKTVLIPFSRCVNRLAASPDFFASPRIVVAVDTEPATPAQARPVLLKDRLFLGHQPSAETIEVVSYNEAAGRFEFQVVSDYAAGKTPRVSYAVRSDCTGCHQGGAPVFPLPPWSETNLDERIAAGIEAAGPHPVSVAAGDPDPYALDRSTDRAVLLSAYQRFWRTGCDTQDFERKLRCRAGALELMLQQRLSAIPGVLTWTDLAGGYFGPVAGARFKQAWPHGIRLAFGDVPNRHPLKLPDPSLIPDDHRADAPRAERVMFHRQGITRLVEGLSTLLPMADLRRVDAKVFAQGRARYGVRWRFRGPCKLRHIDQAWSGGLLTLECAMLDDSFDRTFDVLGEISVDGNIVNAREGLNRLVVKDGVYFLRVSHEGGRIEHRDGRQHVHLAIRQEREPLHAWLADGNAMASLEISWAASSGRDALPSESAFTGEGVLTLVPGFEIIHDAIRAMVERAETEPVVPLTGEHFQGGATMDALLRELGMQPSGWCCRDWSTFPPIVIAKRGGLSRRW